MNLIERVDKFCTSAEGALVGLALAGFIGATTLIGLGYNRDMRDNDERLHSQGYAMVACDGMVKSKQVEIVGRMQRQDETRYAVCIEGQDQYFTPAALSLYNSTFTPRPETTPKPHHRDQMIQFGIDLRIK